MRNYLQEIDQLMFVLVFLIFVFASIFAGTWWPMVNILAFMAGMWAHEFRLRYARKLYEEETDESTKPQEA